jgi:putative MFS transporter
VYVAGAVPLVLVAFARRGLKETARFAQSSASPPKAIALLAHLRGPYGKRILQLAGLWSLTYLCTQSATTFWKDFAVTERGFTDQRVGTALTLAALGSLPLVFFAGSLLDKLGRRAGGALILVTSAVGVVLAYQLTGQWGLTGALLIAIAGTNAVLPLLNAYTTELFPTAMRADAFALANNLLGRVGYIASPALVGWAAQATSWSTAVSATTGFLLAALALMLWVLPETKGLELEQSSAVPSKS